MMKYRTYSLSPPPARSAEKPKPRSNRASASQALPTSTKSDQEASSEVLNARTTKPIIDTTDPDPRLDRVKDTIGTIGHILVSEIIPLVTRLIRHIVRFITAVFRRTTTWIKPSVNHTRQFTINMPSIKLILIVGLFLVGIWFVSYRQISPVSIPFINQSSKPNQSIGGLTPEFDTLLPNGKSIQQLGGWKRVSPPDRNPVFAYVDTINKVNITVSQQPLPQNFSTDPDEEIKNMALEFNAKERVVADDATVYFIGTSSKGPQSIILTKKRLLILIKSPLQIKNETWSAYIASLD